MVLHLWGLSFAGGWRDGRAKTWMAGVVIFLVSIVAAFTGYVSQQNFDAQWIAVNAKDAMNSVGAGAFFNVLNFGHDVRTARGAVPAWDHGPRPAALPCWCG